jgi:uncharacterized membrane protein (DUF106 family)
MMDIRCTQKNTTEEKCYLVVDSIVFVVVEFLFSMGAIIGSLGVVLWVNMPIIKTYPMYGFVVLVEGYIVSIYTMFLCFWVVDKVRVYINKRKENKSSEGR